MNNKKYRHIKKAERLEIAILLNKKYSIRDIAKALDRSPGSISEEIKKNSVKGVYDPRKAQHKAYVRRKYSKFQGMKVENNLGLRQYVETKIAQDWSPEQIAGRIKKIEQDIKYASRQAIYKFIFSPYGRDLEKHLRYKGKKRRAAKRPKAIQLQNRLFIEQRPEIINIRARFGDWEGDLIVSNKTGNGVLLVLCERKSKYVLIEKILSRKASIINQRIQQLTGGMIDFKSLTVDNDISFSLHQALSQALRAPVYFCHPYHSWEKGTVENTNKLIRRYVPKGSDISKYSNTYINEVARKLNSRPRKCLDYQTPLEVMLENNQFKTINNFDIIWSSQESNKILIKKQAECSA